MSLVQDSFTFFNGLHGLISERETGDLPLVIGQFFGVRGESHIVGEQYGSVLTCELILDGYASLAALGNDIVTLKTKRSKLNGTLVEQSAGGFTRSWPNTTFLGFEEQRPVFFDGSGANGWVQFLNLFWRHTNNGVFP